MKVTTDSCLFGAWVAREVQSKGQGIRNMLDIGTGTGLIALMLAQRCDAGIAAIEPDYDSYIQCCENVSRSRWKERIKIEHTALQNFIHADKFDLIITNPPFFTDSLKNPDPRKSASRHNDTLSNKELLEGASRLMAEGGRLQVIMPYAEGNIFIAEASEHGFYCNNILKIRPLPTSEIRRMILTFSKQLLSPTEKFLTIEHGKRHEFTEEYINLTKDFYLKF
jgi:tRNA1Val (adenine37-N6)-methyltransferase